MAHLAPPPVPETGFRGRLSPTPVLAEALRESPGVQRGPYGPSNPVTNSLDFCRFRSRQF
jgi:hypothetical protein